MSSDNDLCIRGVDSIGNDVEERTDGKCPYYGVV